MKLITTKAYLLLVDEEAEIKHDDYYLSDDGVIYVLTTTTNGENPLKIIAYFPIKMGAGELDLPLLPYPYQGNRFDLRDIELAFYSGRNQIDHGEYKDFVFKTFEDYSKSFSIRTPKVFTPYYYKG